MAKPGVKFEMTDQKKELAYMYVRVCGFRKNRLAKYLGICRGTLDRLLKEDKDFSTQLESENMHFCRSLIELAAQKNPIFLLKTMFGEEFGEERRQENALKALENFL